jgi:hypothetical protein
VPDTLRLKLYWTLAEDKTHVKSEDQIRRWKNLRKKTFANFIRLIGDLPISEITADDMIDFREWWWERIRDDGLAPNSANKDFSCIAGTLRILNKRKRLGLTPPFR